MLSLIFLHIHEHCTLYDARESLDSYASILNYQLKSKELSALYTRRPNSHLVVDVQVGSCGSGVKPVSCYRKV